jgi:hypothetical protein
MGEFRQEVLLRHPSLLREFIDRIRSDGLGQLSGAIGLLSPVPIQELAMSP